MKNTNWRKKLDDLIYPYVSSEITEYNEIKRKLEDFIDNTIYLESKNWDYLKKENLELQDRVREAESIKDLNLAIIAVYKLIGYSDKHLNEGMVNYATHLVNKYEQHKISCYIRKLERDLTELMAENRELRRQVDL